MSFMLHNYRRCPFCIRVRLVLLFKQIPCKLIEEDLKNKSPLLLHFFKTHHPDKRPTVPLLLDEQPIFESLDIMEYLHNHKLSPDLSTADFRQWGDWSAKELRDAIQLYKYGTADQQTEGAMHVQALFLQLDKKLSPNLTGESLALADFAVWPFVRQAMRVRPQLVDLPPKVAQWYENIESHPLLSSVMDK
jgi:glutathione S-transferase